MRNLIQLGTKIFNPHNSNEFRRLIVFTVRAFFYRKPLHNLFNFFEETPLKKELAANHPWFFEQATRHVFYKGSTIEDRCDIITEHFAFLTKYLTDESLQAIYLKEGLTLWEKEYKGQNLSLIAKFNETQKREGLISLILKVDLQYIYQIIFWIFPSKEDGNPAIWIGAMQGLNTPDAQKTIKELTKEFYGYRTKNLILYMVRSFAHSMGIDHIYAVTNKGHYAQNHIRMNRKLKTSLDDFWQEADGILYEDSRFYQLPVIEHRKSIEEIKTHKRNLYRNRFALLDTVDQAIAESLANVQQKIV